MSSAQAIQVHQTIYFDVGMLLRFKTRTAQGNLGPKTEPHYKLGEGLVRQPSG